MTMAPTTVNEDIITSLNPNDVLLGRGNGYSDFIGNQRFRDLTDARKDEYRSFSKFDPKHTIVNEIYEHITAKGGRFLRLVDTGKSIEFITEEGEWKVVSEKVALEKIKQLLREKKRTKQQEPEAGDAASRATCKDERKSSTKKRILEHSESDGSNDLHSDQLPFPSQNQAPNEQMVGFPSVASSATFSLGSAWTTQSSCFPSTLPPLPMGRMGGPMVDPRLFLFQPCLPLAALSSPHFIADQPIRNVGIATTDLESQLSGDMMSQSARYGEPYNPGRETQRLEKVDSNKDGDCVEENELSVQPPENDISEWLLSSVALAGRTTISEQEAALERANLPDKDRAEALSDLFGNMCFVNDTHENKKPRRDLGKDSIEFLLKVMRSEIDMLPIYEKQALMEAYSKGRKEEFSDERLLKFLKCEGMNAKLAANRFVNYWKSRREVFKSKYLERLTLSEALRDDLVALEANLYWLLPMPDVSGRPIIYMNPSKHTRENYSSESMVRAFWYLTEVALEESDDTGGAIVEVVWNKSISVFDYDKELHDRILYFQDHSWPMKCALVHMCCAPRFVSRIISPVLRALRTKASRARTMYHNVPETEIIESLSQYGILGSMLPTEMGGRVEFSQIEWLSQRRSIEMEEIE